MKVKNLKNRQTSRKHRANNGTAFEGKNFNAIYYLFKKFFKVADSGYLSRIRTFSIPDPGLKRFSDP